jgi:RimJ/RimL family protein N-acetyltransferase
MDWPVKTERLLIRPTVEADLEASWAIRRLPEVSRWITRAPATIEDYRSSFLELLPKTLLIERDGEVIGDLMLDVQDGWAQLEVRDRARAVQAEIGWVLHPAQTGQGYATEAVRALLGVCFTDLGLRRVTAGCFAANTPSWRLMERVGMRREIASVRESLHRTGEWMDGYGYAMLAEEWTG